MKSLRKSRNTESRNARKEMAIRGRASRSRSALFDADVVMSGRRFRRANKLTHDEVAELNAIARQPDGLAYLRTLTFQVDGRAQLVPGLRMTT